MSFEDILYDVADDGVATLTINRPERMNALRPQTTREMREAIEAARDDDGVPGDPASERPEPDPDER